MPQDKNNILARELGKLGGPLAGLVAKLLPQDVLEITVTVAGSPEEALEVARSILSCEGEVIEDRRFDPNTPGVCAVVGSGFLNLNPTIVEVRVVSATEGATTLLIIGTAKEGLIKQHAGEKAAKRIAKLLTRY